MPVQLGVDGRRFTPLGDELLGRQGHWVGAKVGLFATTGAGASRGGYVDVDWIRVTRPIERPTRRPTDRSRPTPWPS
jgi:hypothetical protein